MNIGSAGNAAKPATKALHDGAGKITGFVPAPQCATGLEALRCPELIGP